MVAPHRLWPKPLHQYVLETYGKTKLRENESSSFAKVCFCFHYIVFSLYMY